MRPRAHTFFFRRTVAVWLFFALLSGVVLAPLSLQLNSHVPGTPPDAPHRVFDYFHFHWNLWWLRYAVGHGESIWYTDKVLAPFTHNLTYHSLTASMLPFYAALEPLVGHVRAANSIIWLSLTLSGALMYAYLRRHSVSHALALLGGVMLACSPYMLDHAGNSHLNLITAWWLPLVLIAWEQTERTHRWRWALLSGLILWGMWVTDTLIVLWGGLLLGPYALYMLGRAPNRSARLRLLALGAAALALTFALAWWLGPLRPTLEFDTSQLARPRLSTVRYYSMSLREWYWPTPGRALPVNAGRDATLGVPMVALVWGALVLTWRRGGGRGRWFWLAAALPALVLALGPDEDIFGVRVVMPFRALFELFAGQMRTPVRFVVPGLAALIVFLTQSYDPLWRRVRSAKLRLVLATGVALVFLWDSGAFQPISTIAALRPYHFHAMMRAENYPNYDYVVLDVPVGASSGFRDVGTHPEAMVFGITHQKRQVSGFFSRVPSAQQIFYETDPLLGWLTNSRSLDPSAAASALKRYITEWPIGYVVVHLDWLTPQRAQEVLAFLNAQDTLCYVTAERDAVLYRTTGHPKGCLARLWPRAEAEDAYLLTFGTPSAKAELSDAGFVGSGWYAPENIGGESGRWACNGGTEALLYVGLPPTPRDYTLTVRAVAFGRPRTVQVTAGALVEGELHSVRLGQFTAPPGGWGEYTLPTPIPADFVALTGGQFALSLAADGCSSAAELGLSEDARPLSLAYDWARLRAERASTASADG